MGLGDTGLLLSRSSRWPEMCPSGDAGYEVSDLCM